MFFIYISYPPHPLASKVTGTFVSKYRSLKLDWNEDLEGEEATGGPRDLREEILIVSEGVGLTQRSGFKGQQEETPTKTCE